MKFLLPFSLLLPTFSTNSQLHHSDSDQIRILISIIKFNNLAHFFWPYSYSLGNCWIYGQITLLTRNWRYFRPIGAITFRFYLIFFVFITFASKILFGVGRKVESQRKFSFLLFAYKTSSKMSGTSLFVD